MYYSTGTNLTAGVPNTILTVPKGHHAKVTMLFLANVGGSTAGVAGYWDNQGTVIPFQGDTSVGAGTRLEFGGQYGYFLIMKDGDSLVITPDSGSTFTSLISFELYPHAGSNYII